VTSYHVVAESDHEIQNPTSAEKIRLLGRLLELGPEAHVLDVACGRGGPALVLASAYGCRITGVERAREFAEAARARVAEAGLSDLVDIIEADARTFQLSSDSWDAALCLGATFIWDDLAGTLAALVPAVRPGGHVAVGEPFWRQTPVAGTDDLGYVGLAETVNRFESSGLVTVGLIGASLEDWDRYESLHWRAVESWLAEHPDESGVEELRSENEQHRSTYIEERRERLGWALIAGRKPT
jgi:SAM-dependent methyltransferase